jgi:hypothetical protein
MNATNEQVDRFPRLSIITWKTFRKTRVHSDKHENIKTCKTLRNIIGRPI